MTDAAAVTLQTQPTTETPTATVEDLPAGGEATADTERAPPAEVATEETKQEPPKELVSEKYAKAAAAHRRAQEERRLAAAEKADAMRLKAEVAAELEKIRALKSKKGMALLQELGIDPEEHLSDVLINGKPDPVAEARAEARQAKEEAAAVKKALEEREEKARAAADQERVRANVTHCASFIVERAADFPHAAHLLSPEEIQRAVYLVHKEALEDGLGLTFEQVGKAVEARAKATYEDHEKRRQRLAAVGAQAPQSSEAGPSVKRPVNSLTNKDASQTAAVGAPEKTREQRKKELIAELEARAAADKR